MNHSNKIPHIPCLQKQESIKLEMMGNGLRPKRSSDIEDDIVHGSCRKTLVAIYKAIENTRIHRYLKEKFEKPIGHISKNQLQHEMNKFFDMTSYPHKTVSVGNLNFTEAPDNPDAQLARFGVWYVGVEVVRDNERGDYVKTTISYLGEEHVFGNQDFNVDFDIRTFKSLALSDMILFCQIQETVEAFEMLLNEQPENEMASDWYEDWLDDLSDREKLLHGLLWANE